jgi:hypothetical protein
MSTSHPIVTNLCAYALVGGLAGVGGALIGIAGTMFGRRRRLLRERDSWRAEKYHTEDNKYEKCVRDTQPRINLEEARAKIAREQEAEKRKLLSNPGIVVREGLSDQIISSRFQSFKCADGLMATLLTPGEPLLLGKGCRLFIKGRFAICCDLAVNPGAQLGFEQLYKPCTFDGKTLNTESFDLFAGEFATWKRGHAVKNSCFVDNNVFSAFVTQLPESLRLDDKAVLFNHYPVYAPAYATGFNMLVEGGLVIAHWRPDDTHVQSWVQDSHVLLRPVMKVQSASGTDTTEEDGQEQEENLTTSQKTSETPRALDYTNDGANDADDNDADGANVADDNDE